MAIVEFETSTGRRLLINARREATSVLVNGALALNYDREGRLTGAWIEGRNYRRSLDNRVIEKQEGPQPGLSYRVRRELPAGEARAFLAGVYARVRDYQTALSDPATRAIGEPSPSDRAAVQEALARVLDCSPARLESDRETFNLIYRPVSILPPDQYLALVLQATEGCSYNRCAFCGFYRDRSFRTKSLEEFQQHIRDVRSFFGGALSYRKSIFLADANALVMPQRQLVPMFDAINAEFAIHPRGLDRPALKTWESQRPIHFDGIYSFVDAFTTRRKSPNEFDDLAARGLRRVYIGLESGDPELLRFLGKPNTPDDVQQLTCHVKAGGVAVGLVILAGAGGERFREQHVKNTVELVKALPLDEGDLVYFSEMVDYAGSEYSALAREAGIRSLSIDEIEHQMAEMRAGFDFASRERAPKVSYYDIREFIY
ncbi:MAG: radical SAM protein [Chloroflexi bacterium]|nr:radical SAM protein [Chloroflexota bacterium]